MTVEKAIQLSIEGGWKVKFKGKEPLVVDKDKITEEGYNDIFGFILQHNLIYQALLDPLFWQGLGKSMGWKQPVFYKGRYADGQSFQNWLGEWHRLIDTLAGGGTIEGYFATLNP